MTTAITTPQTNANDWEAILPTIRHMYANGATDAEFRIFCETARALNLNPILKQIWCVKNKKRPELPAQIYASRDGLITIAHRSGQFDGMESGVRTEENGEMIGWCRVWRKDMSHPFYEEVPRSEYDTKANLWASHPTTMLKKVVEAHTFKRAFDICGVYTPDEMGEQGEQAMIQNAAPLPALQQAETPRAALSEGAAQFAGNIGDMMHCYECGDPIDPTREGRVSKRDHGRYLCLKHLKLANQELEAASNPAPKPAPKPHSAAPKAVAEPAPEEQPSTSLKEKIDEINARQDEVERKQKAPLPPLCSGCGKSVTADEMGASLKVCPETLCAECLALMQDEPQKSREMA